MITRSKDSQSAPAKDGHGMLGPGHILIISRDTFIKIKVNEILLQRPK